MHKRIAGALLVLLAAGCAANDPQPDNTAERTSAGSSPPPPEPADAPESPSGEEAGPWWIDVHEKGSFPTSYSSASYENCGATQGSDWVALKVPAPRPLNATDATHIIKIEAAIRRTTMLPPFSYRANDTLRDPEGRLLNMNRNGADGVGAGGGGGSAYLSVKDDKDAVSLPWGTYIVEARNCHNLLPIEYWVSARVTMAERFVTTPQAFVETREGRIG